MRNVQERRLIGLFGKLQWDIERLGDIEHMRSAVRRLRNGNGGARTDYRRVSALVEEMRGQVRELTGLRMRLARGNGAMTGMVTRRS